MALLDHFRLSAASAFRISCRIKTLTLAAVLFASGCVTTDEATLEVPYSAEEVALRKTARSLKVRNPFLWTVQKDGTTSHLFGTIHSGVDARQELPLVLLRKVRDSAVFVMETNTDEGLKPFLSPARRKQDKALDLRKELTPDAWERLHNALPIDEEVLARMPPAIAALLYAAVFTLEPEDMSTGSMDQALHDIAKEAGKQLRYLETSQDYETLFSGRDAIASLEEILGEDVEKLVRESRRSTYKLLAAYRKGDLETLDRLITAEAKDDPMAHVLISKRNEIWLERLQPILRAGNAFIAVGVGHMTGEKSLLKLLEGAGYTVTRQ